MCCLLTTYIWIFKQLSIDTQVLSLKYFSHENYYLLQPQCAVIGVRSTRTNTSPIHSHGSFSPRLRPNPLPWSLYLRLLHRGDLTKAEGQRIACSFQIFISQPTGKMYTYVYVCLYLYLYDVCVVGIYLRDNINRFPPK